LYLKSLEIYGFKSFADKVKLEFKPGITAIVGPNGCGKSNITDAIRWVLGEQSARLLRGNRMEDVIFKGSSSRRPLGIAEVSLTIDNSDGKLPIDYSEVTIKRRIYRSGESEYYLNRTRCRLIDINELLMDTGIGKEGYSIIGQGRIDEILRAKSDERRMIFEEAAGIVKYKTRKQDAENKLEETEKNLLRLDDIIEEIENQLEPLKKQAVKAKKYLDLKDKLKQMEVNLIVNKMLNIRKELEELSAGSENLEKVIQENREKRGSLEQQLEKGSKKLNEIEDQLYEKQKQSHECSSQLQRIKDELTRNKEKKEAIENKDAELMADREKSLVRISFLKDELQAEMDKYRKIIEQMNEKEKLLNKKQIQLDALTEDINHEESDIEQHKSEVIDLLNEIAEKKNKFSSATAILNNLKKEKARIEHRIADTRIELAKIKKSLDENHTRIDEAKADIQQYRKELKEKEKELGRVNKKIAEILQTIDDKQKLLGKLVSKKNILENVEELDEGLYEGVRNVLKSIKSHPPLKQGFCGIVADLLETDKEYELAVETALGASMQFIVTESDEHAKRLIAHLKKNSLGRATFLPINTAQPRNLTRQEYRNCQAVPGFIGSALEVIRFDVKYSRVFSNLLGRVALVKDIDAALEMARKNRFRFKIVTLTGDVINPGGSLTGGSSRRRNNFLLTRKRQISDLETRTKKLQQEIKELIFEKSGLTQKQIRLETSKRELETSIHKAELTLNALTKEQEQLLDRQKNIHEEVSALREESREINETLEEMQLKIDEIQREISYKQRESEHLQKHIKDYQARYKKNRLDKELLAEEITNLKVELASMRESEKRLKEKIERLEERVKEENNRVSAIDNSIKSNNDLKKLVEQETIELQEKEIIMGNKLEQIFKELNELKNSKHTTKEEIEGFNHDIKSINQKIGLLQKKIHDLEVKETRIQVVYQNLENRLWELYNMSFQEGKKYRKEIEDYEAAEKEVERLKQKIKGLGEVNVGAIEEYKQLKKRYDFLISQRKDLTEAKDSLYTVISEIIGKMKNQFVKNLNLLNQNFKEVFKELFGGGDAQILLQNPDDPLQSGIEIVAQPPGKKLQNLSLLSGGERALTAIAILFAILKLKPTPFCVLDEIEAALDDANVERFANYLKKLSKKTQFIVVTHSKGTMEVCQTLYGVTMEKNAVSKLVSVRLEDAS